MEPEQTPIETEQENKFANLKKVTPVSKYLAMVLFVILPFIGGWIGYTYAPEKVVEVEKVVVVDTTKISQVTVDDISNKEADSHDVTQVFPKGVLIQEIVLDDGSKVSLWGNRDVQRSSEVREELGCVIPNIDIIDATVLYKEKKIPLGEIGVPFKTSSGDFPVIENISYNVTHLETVSFEWTPLLKLSSGFGFIDYRKVSPVSPEEVSNNNYNFDHPSAPRDGKSNVLKSCFLEYSLDYYYPSGEKDVDSGGMVHGGYLYLYMRDVLNRENNSSCSPFGCG